MTDVNFTINPTIADDLHIIAACDANLGQTSDELLDISATKEPIIENASSTVIEDAEIITSKNVPFDTSLRAPTGYKFEDNDLVADNNFTLDTSMPTANETQQPTVKIDSPFILVNEKPYAYMAYIYIRDAYKKYIPIKSNDTDPYWSVFSISEEIFKPGEQRLLNLGFYINNTENYIDRNDMPMLNVAMLFSETNLTFEKRLELSPGVQILDMTGNQEYKVLVTNTSQDTQILHAGETIARLTILNTNLISLVTK